MALYYDLPVFKDTYRLTMWLFEATESFPRQYKYTLGQDIKRDTLQLMRSIYRANKAQNKTTYLESFLDEFELVKLEVRLSADMKLLSRGRQAKIAELMESIGRQISGWRRAGL